MSTNDNGPGGGGRPVASRTPRDTNNGTEANYTPQGIESEGWTGQSVMDAFEASHPYQEPHLWQFGMDFDSDLEAALHWARVGFEVSPAGWHGQAFLTRPEDIAVAWSGHHLRDAVMARAPRGTYALANVGDGPNAPGLRFYGQGPVLEWDGTGPHHHRPLWDEPGVFQTFTVRWEGVAVHAWTVPEGFTYPEHAGAHHFPDAQVLTGARFSTAFPLPCRSSSVMASGLLQPAPPHVLRLADPAPLPCHEQDVKGHPCYQCTRHNNARGPEVLDATNANHMRNHR